MESTAHRAIAIVGVGAVLPDAPNVTAFWNNLKSGRYSISEVASDRWNPDLYYHPDRTVPDKSYSKIGGWVRDYEWNPAAWRLPIPPRVAEAMDGSQKWGILCTREVLQDYGYPKRSLDLDRTAVILGNAMGGEKHYLTILRLYFPEYARELESSPGFSSLPESVRHDITRQLHDRIDHLLPDVTEDTMPGELSNCIAGRIANLFNFHGPNYVVDAACASAMAAMTGAMEGLIENDFDAVVTGGIDRNMGASTFIKFCKIGALSGSGSRPYAEGADGFVMGEGAALFLMKRLADAERNGDNIYAVIRGIGGSSDGKGKGITAPNPIGQKFAIERAWKNAGLSPETVTMIEGHGTSTAVGDLVEMQSMAGILDGFGLPNASVALGSVKSNIGHLKGAAGAAGLLKAALALHDRVIPPSVNCERPNPDVDFAHSPLYVNRALRPWDVPKDTPRRAGLSAFGFGGTNFHAVLEEHIPGRLNGNGKKSIAVGEIPPAKRDEVTMYTASSPVPVAEQTCKAPLRGVLVIGAETTTAISDRLREIQKAAEQGRAPQFAAPGQSDLQAPQRIAIDYADPADLADKASKALKALISEQAPVWKALRAQGIYRGSGPAPKVAFLYTGQGSQYVNMLRPLFSAEPIVADTFAEADRVMKPLLGKPLTDFIFVDSTQPEIVANAESDLRQTEITQPAVLASDEAMTRLLAAYGIRPDMTMGHSLGEYGALVAAGALPFADALEAVSARGRGMTAVAMDDNGKMAAVFAPLSEIERISKSVDGYVVIANINSNTQAVIGGATKAVEKAMELFQNAGYETVAIPVSHAFHTSIVAGAGVPLRKELERLHLRSPQIPIVANVDGEFYPMGPDVVPKMLDILTRQVACPVQFVKGLQSLYAAGARVFVEVGPKKALQGFAEDVLASRGDVITLFTNHPKTGDIPSFNQALCALYAAGLGRGREIPDSVKRPDAAVTAPSSNVMSASPTDDARDELGRTFAEFLERTWKIYKHRPSAPSPKEPVVITGAALGLPGTSQIFDDNNIASILRGEQFIDVIPTRFRQAMVEKHITRLVKTGNGGPAFALIDNLAEVIKLAARGKTFDLEKEFGVSAERIAALDRVTQLAIAVGIDALRDAGIPLVMRYKTTSKGTQLPDRWTLPDSLRDDTGVIFASAFPGYDSFADEMERFFADRARREKLDMLLSVRERMTETNGSSTLIKEIDRRITDLRTELESKPYQFDRRFLFRILAMGHSQFAEFIGARGPNTQVNSACASTAQAMTVAEDWIRAGRCSRVIVISADDVTSDHLLEWIGAGFLATGAAATDEVVEDAAIPFDRRRHGMIIGMGAAALIVESAQAARERGIRPICEVLSTVTENSAFHGTRLDIQHIAQAMEELIAQAEQSGISRHEIAPKTVFLSHETYTPARGGSASAEVNALRHVFGAAADQIVIANTKGFTGHAMGTGIEDVVAVKVLETGCVPPVANFKEVDPELGALNLSKGGIYPVEYALHLAAGFGSQISMVLLHWMNTGSQERANPNALGYAYRIADANAWKAWLHGVAGHEVSDLEIVHRTLRVPDKASVRLEATPKAKPADIAVAKPVQPAPAVTSPVAASSRATLAPASQEPAPMPAAVLQPEAPVPTVREPAAGSDAVRNRVLALVVEKTGYPEDMLDLDLDLEADLGVDTVKQAEMFAAIREIYNIPRDENRKLRDYPTLAHVIRFVYEKRPDLASAGEISPAAIIEKAVKASEPVPAAAPEAADAVRQRVLQLVVEKTGYPKDMLELDLDLEADLGVDTVKQAEMFAAIRETYNIPRDENRKLRDYPTLAHVIRFVYEKRPDLAARDTVQPESKPVEAVCVTVAPAAPAPSIPIPTDDEIEQKVLEIVVEKTGYPKDMLDLDLDLEADLGIDTVKQAEMFASVRATFNIPRDAELKLRDFPTLAHVIQFARDRRPTATTASTQIPSPEPAAVSKATEIPPRPVLASFDACNQIPRRVPRPLLRPPLALCKKTSVTLGRGKRIVIMPDQGGVATALTSALTNLGVEVLSIPRTASSDDLEKQLKACLSAGPISGVYWLPALDHEGDLHAMDTQKWREAVRVRVKMFYAAMRILYEQIAKPATFLLSATVLGGQHGYDDRGAIAPLGGAVVGFTKAYKRERMEALVKAIDFESGIDPARVAQILIDETLADPGALEIGYEGNTRWSIALEEQSATDGGPGLVLSKDTVFLITGAAGSIVSAITADLAAASGGTFYLLDLVAKPNPNNPDLKRFVTDKEGLKRELFTRIQARGERATPALVERELAALERAQAAQSAIDAVHSAGGQAHYFAVDLQDSDAVCKVISEVRARSGRIDVLLHAAGIERSHFLPDKEPREFDLVFDVKANGWFHLLRAIGDMPLGATVAFSSIAGRFGNGGQTDYSSANDLLCKITSSFRTTRPSTRGIVIDWTAWGGIGMATRGSIPKMMEIAGIDMLPPESGIPLIRRELTCGSTRGEVLIGQRLGALLHEFDPDGGVDVTSATTSGETHSPVLGPMIGRIASARADRGLTVETVLDPRQQPFLHDHQIDGTPVLPGVMGIEAFAEAAQCLLPDWHIESIKDVSFMAPFKFYRQEPRQVTVEAIIRPEHHRVIAACRLNGSRTLPNLSEPQVTTHFLGQVTLTREAPQVCTSKPISNPQGALVKSAEIYRAYFHGPAYQVIEKAWWDGHQVVGLFAQQLPDDRYQMTRPTLVAPRLIELCFQTAGLWEMGVRGRMGLPFHIGELAILQDLSNIAGPSYAVVTPNLSQESFDAEVVDSRGNLYLQLRAYSTIALPNAVDSAPLKAIQNAMSHQAVAA